MHSIQEINSDPIFQPPAEMLEYFEYFEIDCDELDFPNLIKEPPTTTINSLPNEILERINLQKDKLEMNDIFDNKVTLMKNNKTSNAKRFLRHLKSIPSLTLNKAREQYNRLDIVLTSFVNYHNETQQEITWNKKIAPFKSIKKQREYIIDFCIIKFGDFEQLLKYCKTANNFFMISLTDGIFSLDVMNFYKEYHNCKYEIDNRFSYCLDIKDFTKDNDILTKYAETLIGTIGYIYDW